VTGTTKAVWALLAFGMALGSPLLVYQGVILDGDDVLYARLASDMAEGHPTFGINTHTYRLGFIVPVAVLYRVFGIHDWTTVALPLLSSLSIVLVAAYAAGRLYGETAGAWAALFCGFNPIVYRVGSVGMADVPAGFLYGVFVAGWLLIVANRVSHRRVWAVLAGVACAWAVASRESALPMVLLTLLGFLFIGWRQGTLRKFPVREWLAGCCLIGLSYVLYLWWHTGTPFYLLQAAQGGYNFAGAPWLRPLEGLHLAARLTGLSILRAMIEGYLFAVLPVLVAWAIGRRSAPSDVHETVRRHLLVAIASPLVVLSHFSTSVSQWVPVHLDLRFGSPVVIPAGLLVAGACLRFQEIRLSHAARGGTGLALAASVGLLWLGWEQENRWSMVGAGAAVVASVAVLLAHRMPAFSLPTVLVVLLVGSWGMYRLQEYPQEKARNAAVRREAAAVPRDPMLPILTDPLTAQILPYLNKFERPPQVAAWNGPEEVERPFYWTERTDRPWARKYLLVWHPDRARTQAQRWGTEVPAWVQKEVRRGRLLQEFPGEPGAGIYLVESVAGL
jgi:4-amino-4-deoxy-L-arabinose transferase-like glycosyltransferase